MSDEKDPNLPGEALEAAALAAETVKLGYPAAAARAADQTWTDKRAVRDAFAGDYGEWICFLVIQIGSRLGSGAARAIDQFEDAMGRLRTTLEPDHGARLRAIIESPPAGRRGKKTAKTPKG